MIDSDNFNRADSTTNPGSTSGSRAWSAARGTWGILSNALYTSAINTTGQGAILVSDFGENDVTLSIDAAARASNIVQLGLVFRYVDLNNHWYWVVYRDNGANPKYFLIKRVAGVDTTVATGALANNNACTVSVEVNGSSIVGKVDGSTIASTTDSALATATSHGLNIYGSNTHTLDNFALTGGHNVSGGQATETDTANAGTQRIVVQGSQVTETDSVMSAMAINLAASASSSDASSYSTPSITPAANTLLLVAVSNEHASAAALPTLSGCGLTWDQIDTVVSNAGFRRLTLFRAMGSPSPGAVTADFGGATQIGCTIIVDQIPDTDTSGTNGSGAIVQSANLRDDSTSAGSTTVTLSTFASVDNRTYGAFKFNANNTITAESGYIKLGSVGHTSPDSYTLTEYKMGADTSVSASTGVGDRWYAIAVEIKRATVAPMSVSGSQATETDTANAGTPRVVVQGSMATETDTANAGTIVTPPLNDDFVDAIDLGSAASGTIAGSIVGATEEPSEPSPSIMTDGDDLIYNTIWYKWTAPADGEATFDTRGSLAVDTVTELDTVLAAWEGAALAALMEVASNDDHDYPPTLTPDRWSRITFNVVEGTVYRIQVGGWGDAESYPNAVGSTILNWTMTAVAAAWPPRLGLFDALPL